MRKDEDIQGLCDMHCHIIPGVDDGARSMEDALAILEDEKKNGVSDIIITPHYRRDMFETDRQVVLKKFLELKEEAARLYPGLRLYPGCEFHANMDMEQMVSDEPLYRMIGSRYILLEFSGAHPKEYIRERTYALLSRGYTPILAHIERYPPLVRDMSIVGELKDMGAMIQVNADALIGKDGWGFRGFSRKLLKNDLIDFVGSDTHNRTGRACHLEKAYRYVSRKLGNDEADRIFIGKPMKIIEAVVQVV